MVIRSEKNMQIHLFIALMVVIFGWVFDISALEWIACFICIGLVFGAELFNTSIENVVDLISPDLHPLAGKAKDMAAGAVLIAAFFSVIVGLIIFVPKVWNYIISIY